MSTLHFRLRCVLSAILLCSAFEHAAQAAGRAVEIRWDFTATTTAGHLEVWVNCSHESDVFTCSNQDVRKYVTPSAGTFELKSSDTVTLIAIFEVGSEAKPDIKFTVTGTNLDDKDLDKLKELFGAAASSDKGKTPGSKTLDDAGKDAWPKRVTEALIAGGKLNVVFELHQKDDDGKDKVTETSGGLDFMIRREPPRLTVSYGLGFSRAATPAVSINKSSTIVTFTKDGKSQQAYQQVIALKDADPSFKPIQSLVTMANFRLLGPAYVSLGVPVNNKIFESPIAGVTYRLQAGKAGLNLTVGTQFSHETAILSGSGFTTGQLIEPSLALTADDVPTEKKWHRRLAMGLTIDFQ